jgi:7,8-dihydroneopterin aldolase/epimerase/oxygenase
MAEENASGWIQLSGLRVDGARVGVYAHERPRSILVDVGVFAPTLVAANTDNLDQTVDYDRLAHLVLEVGRARHYKLLETMCDKLAAAIFERFPVSRVRVAVHKPEATHGATATVSIERQR